MKTNANEKKTRRQSTPLFHKDFPESNHIWKQAALLYQGTLPLVKDAIRNGLFQTKSTKAKAVSAVRRSLERRPLTAARFLTTTAALAGVVVFGTVFTFGTTVVYNGKTVGTVENETAASRAVIGMETELCSVLGDSYTIDDSLVSYSTGIVSRSSVVDEASLESTLTSELDMVTYGYSLYVDGTFIGASTNKEALEALLDQVKAPYLNENTQSISFMEDVEIREGYVAKDAIANLGDIVLKLNEAKTGEVIYTVEKGDTWIAIANAHGLTSREMKELNPGFDIDKLQIGDQILISNAVPYLTVSVTQYEYYTAEIPYEIEYIDDPDMWVGDTSVVTPGVYGTSEVTALVTYVGNQETSRDIQQQTTVTEPQTAVYKRGTKERPSWAPTGTFRWPTNGTITSRYGYRYIFGASDFHTGLDIANSYGTNIYAADGGVVTYAGWKSGYGYVVIIDHQNGYETYYAHCSSLLASVGDKVYKGEHIAEMGSTGRSTGNHLHFEVRYNGKTQNPENYL